MSTLKLYTPPSQLSVFAPHDDDDQPVILRFPTGEAVGCNVKSGSLPRLRSEFRADEYRADEPRTVGVDGESESHGSTRRIRFDNSHVDRIRMIRKNRVCPACQRVHVEPVSIGPRLRNRDQMPVPGANVIVGFHCCHCDHEWTV